MRGLDMTSHSCPVRRTMRIGSEIHFHEGHLHVPCSVTASVLVYMLGVTFPNQPRKIYVQIRRNSLVSGIT